MVESFFYCKFAPQSKISMKKLLFTLLFYASTTLFAQKHHDLTHYYVVTNNYDTIHGYIKYQSSEGELKNKITIKVNDTLKLTFTPNEIIYFEEGKNEYLSMIPPGYKEKFFVRVWSSGFYELFEWEVPSHLTKSIHIEYRPLIRKYGEKDFIPLDHKHWKKQLAKCFADYPELAKDVLKGRYPMDEMGHAVDRYNEYIEDLQEGF